MRLIIYIFLSAIKYGAEAYFIFEQSVFDESQVQDVQGNLNVAVNSIPGIKIEGHGSVDMNDDLKKKVKDLKVKFHGDFILETNPTTFEEAVKIYKDLPKFVTGEDAQSVPIKVTLYPLNKIDESKIFAIVKDISESIVAELVEIMQDLEDAIEEAQDIEESTVARRFFMFGQKANKILNFLKQYRLQLQAVVSPLLVEIRSQGKEESELAKVLQNHSTSPFNKQNLDVWFREQRAESAVLESFVQLLDENTVVSKNIGEYWKHIVTNEEVISLTMYFPSVTSGVLTNMEAFLDGREVSESVSSHHSWFRQSLIRNQIQNKITELLDFRDVNSESSILFTYVILRPNDPDQQPYAQIKAHFKNNRRSREEVITTPGSPFELRETSGEQSVRLSWSAPTHGADFIKYYEVVVRERSHRIGQEPIEYTYQTFSNVTAFEITTPEKTEPYDVYVRV